MEIRQLNKETMIIELIPVIEIGYDNQDVPAPDKYPYWEYPELWDRYNSECSRRASFKDSLTPYLAGSRFYRLSDITHNRLTKLVIDHTQGTRDGEYGREQACALSGGYVLRIEGRNIYFPQCCGDLADIQYWRNLASGKEHSYCEGHPRPLVAIRDDTITLDFTVGEYDEHYAPTPSQTIVQIDIRSLAKAIETVILELDSFGQRLERVNQDEKLQIDNIAGLLIWENANYE